MSKRAESGQPLRIAANDWNDVLDLLEPGADGKNKRRLPPGLIRLRNTFTELPMYGAAYYEFSNRDVTAPTTIEEVEDIDLLYQVCDPSLRASGDNWPAICIAQQPIPYNEVGIARVEGETWAKIAFDRPDMRQAGPVGEYTPDNKLGASSNPCAQILGPFPTSAGDYYSRVVLYRRPQVQPVLMLAANSIVTGTPPYLTSRTGYNLNQYTVGFPARPIGTNPAVELGTGYFKMLGNQNWRCTLQSEFNLGSGSYPRGIAVSINEFGPTPALGSLEHARAGGYVQTTNWNVTLNIDCILYGGVKYCVHFPLNNPDYAQFTWMTLTPVIDHIQRRDMH